MNGRASTARVCARTSRAVPVHDVTPMAIVIEAAPWPSTAASAIASGRLGSAMNQSVTCISSRPVRPSWCPATSPMVEPSTMVRAVAITPIASDVRDPQITRSSTERPAGSVPSG